MKFLSALLRKRYQQFPVVPVQMDLIRPMLKRVAAAERRSSGTHYKLRTN